MIERRAGLGGIRLFGILALVLLGGAVEAQGKRAKARGKQPRSVVLDLSTGTTTRGPRASLGGACAPTLDGFPNLDIGTGFGLDIGGGQAEWFCAGVKSSTTPTDLVVGIELAYCSAMLDPSSGGPGGSALLSFYEGFQLGGASPGTRVAAFTLTGLPANSASSSLVPAWSTGSTVGASCYFVSLRGVGSPGSQLFPISSFSLADGPIGYSWRFLDLGTDGVMAGTAPFLACVSSCSGAGPDGLGMLNAMDRYVPPGTYDSTFTASVVGSPEFQSSISLRIREAPEQSRWHVREAPVSSSAYFTGATWDCAFADLQDALSVAGPGDEIWVAQGTYKPTLGTDRSRSFQLEDGVALYGGFAGHESSLSQRNPTLHPTILSGDLLGNDGNNFSNYADNSEHVVVGSGTNASAILDGFVIRGGRSSSGATPQGGGLYVPGGSPTITGCTIEKNWAVRGGGAFVVGGATLTNCLIRDNLGTTAGGGLALSGGASVVGCTIERNGSGATNSGVGGGIAGDGFRMESSILRQNIASQGGGLYDGGRSTIRTTQVLQNSSTIGGGARLVGNGTRIESCNFQLNHASARGGGVNAMGSPVLHASTFLDNTSVSGGGLDIGSSSTLCVTSCRIERNRSTRYGGGAFILSSPARVPTFANCIVRGNESLYGGAFFVYQQRTDILNCTIVGNTARYVGGGIYAQTSSPRISNSVLWGNSAQLSNQIHQRGSTPLVQWSQIQGGWAGTGNSALNPEFISLPGGDLRLQSTSPCIDSAQSLLPPFAFDVDLRQRVFDATPPNNPTALDRGAHEFGAAIACVADCDGDGICDSAEIGPGLDTDLNGNQVPDTCDGKDSELALLNTPVVLLPDGGTGNPTLEPVVEFTNLTQPAGAEVTVVQSDLDLHPGDNTYGTLGKTVTVETMLADGEFFLRLSVPFSFAELGGRHWSTVDLLYFDLPTLHWELAPSANTMPSPGHPGPLGDRSTLSGTSLPVLSVDLGDYGVFFNPSTNRGFAWANVDHTTDFALGVLLGTPQDCNDNAIDDQLELESGETDCNGNGILDGCELVAGIELDCDGNLLPDSCDIAAGRQPDCNGNGIPDACDIASGFSLDVDPANGIPDECEPPAKVRGAPPGIPPGPR